MNLIKKYEKVGLSDLDLLKLVRGKSNVVLYSDINQYNNIDEMIYPYNSAFILYETKPKWGHWCVIFKRGNTLEFFDPYGTYIDDELKHIDEYFRNESNQNYPYLTRLLFESPYDIEYNEHKFQKKGNNIRTCGRWCACRLLLKDLSLEEFCKLFKRKDGDEIVTYYTMWVNS